VHHHVQQLGDIGLESSTFVLRLFNAGHGTQIPLKDTSALHEMTDLCHQFKGAVRMVRAGPEYRDR
jgi:hypothetical protein